MKTTLLFLVLLLIFSVCSGEGQSEFDDEVSPLGKQLAGHGRELHDTPNQQQTCKQDVNAVLREMSAMLAEQRVEIRQLQKENQGRETTPKNNIDDHKSSK